MIPRTSPLRVLIIDDEPKVAAALARLMHQCGAAHTGVAYNGDDALKLLQRTPVDLVLCDLNMPHSDGIQTMRGLAGLENPPAVILLSGSDPRLLRSAEQVGQAHGLTILAALPKPVRLRELRHCVEQLHAPEPVSEVIPHQPGPFSTGELARAITQEQLRLYYQPQINMRTGTLDSAEALLRWEHPELGLIPPDSFVPLAEDSGLIEPLTDWVIDETIRQGSAWRRAGHPLALSVNLPITTLCHLDLPDRLERATQAAKLRPEELTLEMTETGVPDDPEAVLEITTRLRLKRFPLSIDDFGTGNSSLAKLQSLPFSELKIDRMFVRGAARDRKSRALLESTVALAKHQQLKVVAEGIETREEWHIAERLGVDLAQGYFVAKPMPAGELSRFRRSWRQQPQGQGRVA